MADIILCDRCNDELALWKRPGGSLNVCNSCLEELAESAKDSYKASFEKLVPEPRTIKLGDVEIDLPTFLRRPTGRR